ncbi:MAG TPA: hemolysin family protein [Pirellulales bacterium]|nr:hemolysin family protein [Pirellulales bacterium]
MILWFLGTLVCLAIASYAAVGVRCLRRFSRARLDELCRQEHTRPLFSQIVEQRDRATLGAESLQVLATLAVIVSGVAWTRSLAAASTGAEWLESVEAIVGGVVVLWFALVWLPTSVARLWADSFVLHSWSLWKAAAVLLAPSVWGAELLCKLFRRLSGRKVERVTEESLEEEILTIVSEGEREGLLEEDAREMIEGVIELGDVTVARIMTPRTDMVSMHVDLPWDDVIQLAITAGHTRIPAYNSSPDDIVGILHSKDLLVELAKPDTHARQPWQELLRKPFFVPETKPVDELLQEFQRSRNHIAVVLDEFGGVSGIVTIEDALEEIVGEISDEHDVADSDGITRLGEHAAEALARVRIHELNERLGLSLPEDEHFDTIGGFVFHELGRIPNVGEELIWQDVRIKVLEATRRRIDRVSIQILNRPTQPTA